jgi:hypothetical protein
MTTGASSVSGHFLQTINLTAMTAADLPRHWMTTMRNAKTVSTTGHPVMTNVTRKMMTGTVTIRAVEVTVRELRQQTPSIAAAAVTRTSTVHRDHTATEARNLVVATAPVRLVKKEDTRTRRRTPMARRIPMAAHGVSIEVAAIDLATRSVSEIAKIAKSEIATMIMTVRRIVPVIKIRTEGGAASVKLKTTSGTTMTTSTDLHVAAAGIETASDATAMTVSAKTSRPNQRRRRMLLVR